MFSVVLGVIFLISSSESQSCREFFQYMQGNGNIEGFIRYRPPQVSEHNLKVTLSIAAQLPSSYVGELSLYRGTQSTVDELRFGGPLLYRLVFPITNPLPLVTEISHNGNIICTGQGVSPYSSYITTVNLFYKLTTRLFNEPNRYQDNFTPHISNRQSQPQQQTEAPSYYPRTTQRSSIPWERSTEAPSYYPRTTQRSTTSWERSTIPWERTTAKPQYSSSSFNSQCGIRKALSSTPLIIGGISAGRAEFPWLVAQYYRSNFVCGGSLVSNRVIITASHCIYTMSSDQTTFYLGKHDITRLNEDGFVSSEVERFVIHPNYDPQTFDSDIGAAILTKRIVYTSTIKPICLWTFSQGYADIVRQKGIVAGWGLTEHGSTSSTPMYLSLPVVEESVCLRSHPDFVKITSSKTFCVGDKSGRSPCNGDSGGGFVVKAGQRYYLRGVVSISRSSDDGYCIPNEYVVFTDVSMFTNWIANLIETY